MFVNQKSHRKSFVFSLIFIPVFFWGIAAGLTTVHATAIQKMFERLGGEGNTTSPGGFQDQAAGYYTGGSVMLRQKNKAVSPLNITLPHAGAGCGGVDLSFGSVSFVKAQEMVELLRRMGSAVPTYAFQLALKTMAPQVETLLSSIRKMVQDMNGLMLDSCHLTQNALDSLWPKGTAAGEMICQNATRSGNTDWFGARKHCADESKVQQKVEETRAKYPDLMQGEYNLTWHVLQKIPGYTDNQDFAHFIMTIVGTVISRKDGHRFRIQPVEGRGDQKDSLTAYLKGGTWDVLTCDNDPQKRCLKPAFVSTTLPANDPRTMKVKTSQKIHTLWNKYNSDSGLTDEDKAFLSDASQLPIYRYIQVSSAMGSPFMMHDTSEYIAVTLLLSQFDRVTSEVIAALDSLENIQLESSVIEKFKKRLQDMRVRIQALQASTDAQSIYRLNQVIQSYEQVLAARYHS